MTKYQPVPPPPLDPIYQSFGKDLYRITGTEQEDSIMQMMMAEPHADNSTSVTVSASDIGSGVDTSTTIKASGSDQAGKKTYDNTAVGYILGVDPKDGYAKFYIGNTTSYINWDGTTLTVVGGVNISSLNIPDQTTANSFHVDTSGNTWWGANVASGYANANASILSTGAATFKSISIGGSTLQYTVTDSGNYNFGDGSDGDVTISGDTTLTRDMYYNNLTLNSGKVLSPAGYRIFVKNTFTWNGAVTRSGTTGGTGDPGGGSPTAGGSGPSGLATGYLVGSNTAGGGGSCGTGGNAGTTGSAAADVSNSLGSNAAAGGKGGSSNTAAALNPSTPGAATAANVKLIVGVQLAQLLDVSSSGATVKYTNSPSGTGGSSGQSGGGNAGGGGGGGGTAAGMIAIYAKTIIRSGTGTCNAIGGNGGVGGTGSFSAGTYTGSGGGGGAGNGGTLIMVYNSFTDAGTNSVAGGTGGAAGVKDPSAPSGATGTNGSNGTAGVIYLFNLSL